MRWSGSTMNIHPSHKAGGFVPPLLRCVWVGCPPVLARVHSVSVVASASNHRPFLSLFCTRTPTRTPVICNSREARRIKRPEGLRFRPSHHHLTPNRLRLGVFTSRPRNVRGVHAHSACARGWSEPVPVVACSTLFCPLFSGNLRQLFRRSTRTSPCAATTCTCVGVFWFAARSGVADHQAAAKSGDAHGIEYTPWRRLDFTSAR